MNLPLNPREVAAAAIASGALVPAREKLIASIAKEKAALREIEETLAHVPQERRYGPKRFQYKGLVWKRGVPMMIVAPVARQ